MIGQRNTARRNAATRPPEAAATTIAAIRPERRPAGAALTGATPARADRAFNSCHAVTTGTDCGMIPIRVRCARRRNGPPASRL